MKSRAAIRRPRPSVARRSRPRRACARQGANGDVRNCTTTERNAHRTDIREVLYPWHPWAGRLVHLHEAIDRAAGGVVRCTVDGDLTGRRTLELPVWMFDRAVHIGVRMASTPQVDLQSLLDLAVLLASASRSVISAACPSTLSTSSVTRESHHQNRGETDAPPSSSSSRRPRRTRSTRSVPATTVGEPGLGILGEIAGRDATNADESDGSAHDGTRWRPTSRDEGRTP